MGGGGGGINRYRVTLLMYAGSRVRNFRVRHGPWKLVYYHRLEGGDYRCRVGGDRRGL